jgi:hypothetical protein
MKTKWIPFFLFSALPLIAMDSRFENDELWERSLSFVRSSARMVPSEVETREHVVDGKGVTQMESITKLQVSPAAGAPSIRLLQYLENGHDRTERNRREIEKGANESAASFFQELPYAVAEPTPMLTRRRSDSFTVNGVACVGYDFRVSGSDLPEAGDEDVAFQGTVWIDPQSAVPLMIESRMLDLPKKEGDTEITSFVRKVVFDCEGTGWRKVREEHEVWLNTKALLRRNVFVARTQSEYRNHWENPRES